VVRNGTCEQLKQLKYAALRRFRWTNKIQDFQSYIDKRKLFKKTCYVQKRRHQLNEKEKLINSSKNPKAFWQLLKNSQKKYESTIQCISPDSWRTYFQGLLHKENILNINNIAIDEGELPDEQDFILNSEITADEIITSINKLKMGKSQGIDGLGAEFYKASSHNYYNTCIMHIV